MTNSNNPVACCKLTTVHYSLKSDDGEVPERLNGAVSKTVVGATSPGVQIPPSPPDTKVKS